MALTKTTKKLGMSAGIFLLGLYRLGAPFLDETAQMKVEAQKVAAAVQQIRLDSVEYDKAWEDRMDNNDRIVRNQLPDRLNSSDVLDYFLSVFEKQNPGDIKFLAVSQSGVNTVNLGKTAAGQNTLPRVARYKFVAQMNQAKLVPYVEHIEKYAGLFRLNDFNFLVERDAPNVLKMELALEFFMAPKEWVLPDKIAAKTDAEEDEADADDRVSPWRQVFVSQLVDQQQTRKPAAQLKSLGAKKKLPVIEKIVGDSVVSEEQLFEEGDSIRGWRVLKIDSRTKTVTLKSGDVTKTVVTK